MTNPFHNESNSRREDWTFCLLLPNISLFLFFGLLYKIGTIIALIHYWDLDRLVFKRTPLKSVYSCLNVGRTRLPPQIHTKLLVNLPSHLWGGETAAAAATTTAIAAVAAGTLNNNNETTTTTTATMKH